jgi:hypothetical protein
MIVAPFIYGSHRAAPLEGMWAIAFSRQRGKPALPPNGFTRLTNESMKVQYPVMQSWKRAGKFKVSWKA